MSEHGTEQRLYLLGHPISHSKSPVMHNAVYQHIGLPWHYALMDCTTPSDAQAFLSSRDYLAINVTTPYKPLAFEAANACAASAKLVQGANLLVCKKQKLLAFNTDGTGCVAYLEREGVQFLDARVVVCGTGPTALSILHAAAVAGASEVVLLGRDNNRACSVLESYIHTFDLLVHATIDLPAAQDGHRSFRATFEETTFKFGSYATSKQAIKKADIVVDATTLGMNQGDPAPFSSKLLHAGQVAFDVVYGHGKTAFVQGARDAGCDVWDGAGMLVAQAAITMQTVCDIAEVAIDLQFDDLFVLMAQAMSATES